MEKGKRKLEETIKHIIVIKWCKELKKKKKLEKFSAYLHTLGSVMLSSCLMSNLMVHTPLYSTSLLSHVSENENSKSWF